jgi:hypothetical protein
MERIRAFRYLRLARPNVNSFYSSAEYTFVWNALDYPACVFPVTTVDPVLDKPKPAHQFLSEADKRVYELCMNYSVFSDPPNLIVDFG